MQANITSKAFLNAPYPFPRCISGRCGMISLRWREMGLAICPPACSILYNLKSQTHADTLWFPTPFPSFLCPFLGVYSLMSLIVLSISTLFGRTTIPVTACILGEGRGLTEGEGKKIKLPLHDFDFSFWQNGGKRRGTGRPPTPRVHRCGSLGCLVGAGRVGGGRHNGAPGVWGSPPLLH